MQIYIPTVSAFYINVKLLKNKDHIYIYINLHLIYRRIYREILKSGISKSTVNLIGRNALKKDEGWLRWKCIRLTSLF